jgi:hypothetical protein
MRRLGQIAMTAGAALLLLGAEAGWSQEVSPGGSHIYRYDGHEHQFRAPASEAEHVADIEKALKPYLGEHYVYHELESDKVHLDVLVFRPTATRANWTFVTSGMSDLPMHVPQDMEGAENYRFAELVIAVPARWFSADDKGMIPEAELKDYEKFWPVALLKFLGRFPHEYDTWLWESHSMPNGNPATPYADGTKLSGIVLSQMSGWPEQYQSIRMSDGRDVRLFAVVPVYGDEMALKLEKGFDALDQAFLHYGISEVLHQDRSSVAAEPAR